MFTYFLHSETLGTPRTGFQRNHPGTFHIDVRLSCKIPVDFLEGAPKQIMLTFFTLVDERSLDTT